MLHTSCGLIAISAFVPAAAGEPSPAGDPVARAFARPVLDPAEADRWLRDAILARIPRLDVGGDREAWEARAAEIREHVRDRIILAGVPDAVRRAPRGMEEAGTIRTGKGYAIRKLRYEALPGLWIPALLYEPDPPAQDGERLAAVLNPNGHVGPPGKALPEEQVRCINLAKRGIVALKPEWFSFGELAGDGFSHWRAAGLELCGWCGAAPFYLALEGALDVLLARPGIDPARVAVTGLSGGGWQTIAIAALDSRVKAMAPDAGYSGLELRVVHAGSIGDIEQNPPDLAAVADYPLLTAAFAPRPALLIYNARDDCCFPAALARASVYDPVAPLYARLYPGAEFAYHENADPGTHNFGRDNREALYRFLGRLGYPRGPATPAEIPADAEVLDFETLRVGLPRGTRDFTAIALDLARSLPGSPWPREAAGDDAEVRAAFEAWRPAALARLRGALRLAPRRVAGVREAWKEAGGSMRGAVLELEAAGGGPGGLVPVVEVRPATAPAAPLPPVVACADAGRASLAAEAAELAARGRAVLLADPALFGENRPRSSDAPGWAMMASAAGDRALGVQVAQLLAAAAWARAETGSASVELHGTGATAAVVALLAAGLDPAVSAVTVSGLHPTLKALIEERVDFGAAPSLFCFGLLAADDVRDLIALAAPRPVTIRRPAGTAARWEEEAKGIDGLFRALGGPPPRRER